MIKDPISFEDFQKVDLRIGTITEVQDFEKAKKPAYKLKVDFGVLGVKNSSAQITALYTKEELLGKQVIAVVNFSPRQIGNFMSEILVLGIQNQEEVVLLQCRNQAKNGKIIS